MNSRPVVPNIDADDSSFFESFSDSLEYSDYLANGSDQQNDDFEIFDDHSDNNKISGKSKKNKKKPKRKISLSESAQTFKNKYYSIFTKKKKIFKKYC